MFTYDTPLKPTTILGEECWKRQKETGVSTQETDLLGFLVGYFGQISSCILEGGGVERKIYIKYSIFPNGKHKGGGFACRLRFLFVCMVNIILSSFFLLCSDEGLHAKRLG